MVESTRSTAVARWLSGIGWSAAGVLGGVALLALAFLITIPLLSFYALWVAPPASVLVWALAVAGYLVDTPRGGRGIAAGLFLAGLGAVPWLYTVVVGIGYLVEVSG